jgi:hypothetical protein
MLPRIKLYEEPTVKILNVACTLDLPRGHRARNQSPQGGAQNVRIPLGALSMHDHTGGRPSGRLLIAGCESGRATPIPVGRAAHQAGTDRRVSVWRKARID